MSNPVPDPPALFLSLLLASICGVGFQAWQGRQLRELLLFWPVAVVGFAGGQVLGEVLELVPFTLGQIHVVEAAAVTCLVLVIARWFRRESRSK